MKLQKHIKEVVITLLVISITAVTYASLSTVNTGDSLTSTAWNNMVSLVNTNEAKLTNISSNGANVGIGTASPSQKLDVNGSIVSRGTVFIGDGTSSDIRNVIAGTDLNFRNSAGNVEMVLNSSGNLGIGTTTPAQKLDVNGNTRSTGQSYINNINPLTVYQDTNERSAMVFVNSNLFYILRGCGVNSTNWCPYNGMRPLYINLEDNSATFGGTVAATSFNTYSDKRLKKNIKTLDNSLEKVSKLRGVSFDWKSSGEKELGLIAQEVEDLYPDLVETDGKGMKSVKYSNLVSPLIEAIKELRKQNEELKKRVELLENK